MSAEASDSVAATLGVPDPPPATQDPPKLPPKSPLRLRNVASLSAVALTISDASPSISTSAPTPSPHHRPPPLVFPSVSSTPESISNLLSTAAGASSRNTSTTRSLDSRPASLHVSRRPSTASSMLSLESSLGGLMPDTPTSLDTISRLALALPSQSDLDNASSNTGTTFDSQMNLQQSSEADGLGLGLQVPASSSLLDVDRSLPITPSSPSTPSYVPPSTTNPAATAQTSKRVHALNELLTSERVYASDLAVMRNVYIPLALGQKPLMNMPSADPQSSSSASNALLDALGDGEEAPMTPQDVRVVFSNTEELAVFADAFAERIEASMGGALGGASSLGEDGATALEGDDGAKTDSIGALLLEVVSPAAPLNSQSIPQRITPLLPRMRVRPISTCKASRPSANVVSMRRRLLHVHENDSRSPRWS